MVRVLGFAEIVQLAKLPRQDRERIGSLLDEIDLLEAQSKLAEAVCEAFDACETVDPTHTEDGKRRLWDILMAAHQVWLAGKQETDDGEEEGEAKTS